MFLGHNFAVGDEVVVSLKAFEELSSEGWALIRRGGHNVLRQGLYRISPYVMNLLGRPEVIGSYSRDGMIFVEGNAIYESICHKVLNQVVAPKLLSFNEFKYYEGTYVRVKIHSRSAFENGPLPYSYDDENGMFSPVGGDFEPHPISELENYFGEEVEVEVTRNCLAMPNYIFNFFDVAEIVSAPNINLSRLSSGEFLSVRFKTRDEVFLHHDWQEEQFHSNPNIFYQNRPVARQDFMQRFIFGRGREVRYHGDNNIAVDNMVLPASIIATIVHDEAPKKEKPKKVTKPSRVTLLPNGMKVSLGDTVSIQGVTMSTKDARALLYELAKEYNYLQDGDEP